MVGGVYYFVSGIALLIFEFGIYELVISGLIHAWMVTSCSTPTFLGEKPSRPKNNLPNVIVVDLIVAAFQQTIGFEKSNALIFLRCVALWPCWPSVLG